MWARVGAARAERAEGRSGARSGAGKRARRSGAQPGLDRLWSKACSDAGIKGLHFHDLRHTGNTLAASTGASTRELMARMGHSTARAALIYQHASAERDRLIADALSALVDKGRKTNKKQDPKRKGHAGGTAD
ncbi:tyrosine-type recombinase/integrase [Streptomyces africanus]|uniref:tyrosine-type recombinase/integrase n=1 Tax=Streptomyces africanus TaxID=231024 RepID=UPI000A36D42C